MAVVHNRLFYFQCVASLLGLCVGTILTFLGDDVKFFVGVAMITHIIVYWLPNPKFPKTSREIDLKIRMMELISTIITTSEDRSDSRYSTHAEQHSTETEQPTTVPTENCSRYNRRNIESQIYGTEDLDNLLKSLSEPHLVVQSNKVDVSIEDESGSSNKVDVSIEDESGSSNKVDVSIEDESGSSNKVDVSIDDVSDSSNDDVDDQSISIIVNDDVNLTGDTAEKDDNRSVESLALNQHVDGCDNKDESRRHAPKIGNRNITDSFRLHVGVIGDGQP